MRSSGQIILIIATEKPQMPLTWRSSVSSYVGSGCSPLFCCVAAYGLAYFLIHDVYIHRRFKWLRDIEHPYFYAIRRAHKMHHKHLGKAHGECFGMLLVPIRFYIDSAKQFKKQHNA